jgi:hypothetical protein
LFVGTHGRLLGHGDDDGLATNARQDFGIGCSFERARISGPPFPGDGRAYRQ